MSRHLFAFLLSELTTIRIVCKNPACGAVLEVPIANLRDSRACRHCGSSFVPTIDPHDPFVQFADAVRALRHCADRADIEFIVPEKP